MTQLTKVSKKRHVVTPISFPSKAPVGVNRNSPCRSPPLSRDPLRDPSKPKRLLAKRIRADDSVVINTKSGCGWVTFSKLSTNMANLTDLFFDFLSELLNLKWVLYSSEAAGCIVIQWYNCFQNEWMFIFGNLKFLVFRMRVMKNLTIPWWTSSNVEGPLEIEFRWDFWSQKIAGSGWISSKINMVGGCGWVLFDIVNLFDRVFCIFFFKRIFLRGWTMKRVFLILYILCAPLHVSTSKLHLGDVVLCVRLDVFAMPATLLGQQLKL